jgi:DNA (cytosine-5)-methyltransferase 1
VLARLRRAGFEVFQSQLNAADFGVAQRRRRLFIVGLNSQLYSKAMFKFPAGAGTHRCVHDAIYGLPLPQYYRRGITPGEIGYHPNHWTMMPKSAKFTSGHASDGRSFKRLAWDKVSPTVAYGNREIHVHPDGGRRLTILEAMLLQGFPQEYRLTGTLSAQVTQVSNAVPPPVAEAIARSLRSLIESSEGLGGRGTTLTDQERTTVTGGSHGRA